MPANGTKPTSEELLTRGWKALDGSRDYLKEFLARMSALEKRRDDFDRTCHSWELPAKKAA
jgi:hypothetical protein